MEIVDKQPGETTSRRSDPFVHEIELIDASIPSYPSPSSAAVSSREGTASCSSSSQPPTAENPQPAAKKTSRRRNCIKVMQTIDKLELGKHILGLAIPMAMGLVFSNNPLAMTKEMQGVAISLAFAIATIWNGLLLRKTYHKASTLNLILGIAMMMLAFYAFVGCFLPLHLKWIPALCWLASLSPFAMYGWAYFRRKKETDPERGEN